MSTDPKRAHARELAANHLARGDATGWFEELYRQATGDPAHIPWADLRPNPNVVEWLEANPISGAGQSALVVGCGLGDDAECLATRGFRVTAFDISPSAINWCQRRFPDSPVSYEIGNLLAPPPRWRHAYDLVLEAYTLQVLPPELRAQAIAALADMVKPGGMLLVVCRGRNPEDAKGQMPWPLLREEMSAFEHVGLTLARFEEYWDRHEDPPVRRYRAQYASPVC